MCACKVNIKLNGKFYKIATRPTMLYGTKCWAVKNQHIYKIRVVEIRVEMYGKIRFKMRKSA